MGLLSEYHGQSNFPAQFNTGTNFDLATGKFQPGKNGKWYLNGGLYVTAGFTGRNNLYKTALAGSLLARVLLNYQDSEAFVYESEFSIPDKYRYNDFAPVDRPVHDQILFRNRADMHLGEWMEFIQELGEKKLAHKKDYIVEAPFFDPETMKPARILKPTFCVVDSFSKAQGVREEERYDDNDIEDPTMNMLYMADGGLKTRITRQLPTLATRYGFYFILTAHIKDNKADLANPRSKPSKQFQHMKVKDKLVGVGSDFSFLMTALVQNLSASALTDSKDNCMYPANTGVGSPPLEVQEVPSVMLRCKNNTTGTQINWIISQYQGLLNEVTNFHYLKKAKKGLVESGLNFATNLTPTEQFTRKTLREITDKNYMLRRALEILSQINYIQTNWFLPKLPKTIAMPIKQIAELLTKHTKPAINDILNSTGTWSYAKQDREYMSVFDIVELLNKA